MEKLDTNLGFIGCGKMATAIIKGCLSVKNPIFSNICASEIDSQQRENIANQFKIKVFDNNIDVVKNSNIIILCVKPFVIKDVLKEIAPYITNDNIIISIAAGVKISLIKEFIQNAKIIRVMPNTPAMVNEGVSAICFEDGLDEKLKTIACEIMKTVGETIYTEEKYIDIITALSGSGPAFYYKIINDIAKAANKMGLDYETALKLSAQTAIGAGKMILYSCDKVETLIKNVSTKGGCTEVGNSVLNESAISNILEETIERTAKKAKDLG